MPNAGHTILRVLFNMMNTIRRCRLGRRRRYARAAAHGNEYCKHARLLSLKLLSSLSYMIDAADEAFRYRFEIKAASKATYFKMPRTSRAEARQPLY